MIVGATGSQARPRYLPGIAVAVLIVAAYLFVGSNPTAPAPTPSPSPVSVVPPPLPSGLNLGGPQLSAPPGFPGHAPIADRPRPTATPRPTHHVLHSGPPLH